MAKLISAGWSIGIMEIIRLSDVFSVRQEHRPDTAN
jgi:hypothetical protein